MKTVEQRVEDLMATLPYLHKSEGGVAGFKKRLRLSILEAQRDQRHACAEAAMATFSEVPCADSGRVNQAVMNADVNHA